ncbi:hypothetical protein [Streptomyces sp. NPDC089919]|uniref:hypothetical protein n=1 Tax=Streptomyces sp. NPDC089919 TaxID=3155188 RepID=UPI00341C14DA
MKDTHSRVLISLLVGMLAAAGSVILSMLDKAPATDAVRNAAVAFGGAVTLCALVFGMLKGDSGEEGR